MFKCGPDRCRQKEKRGGKIEYIIEPSCVLEANKGMGDFDKPDQMLASVPFMRKCIKR